MTFTTSWLPWQVQQRGASASPFLAALPCRLSAYLPTMSAWQASHVGDGTFSSCGSSLPARAEWQPTQGASAWTDFARRFWSTKSDTV